MVARVFYARVLVVLGLAAMLLGAIDPLEGSFIVLPGAALSAVGASVGKSRYVGLLCWSVVLVAFGVAAMVVLSWMGGIGGHSGHSIWWGLTILPYPVGWLMGLVGTALVLIESRKNCGAQRQATPLA